jgi:DNA-binding beta-propeller fold protein YncE
MIDVARSRRICALALTILALAVATLNARRQTAPVTRMASKYASGPIAVSAREGSDGVVLQADGRAYALNMATGAIGAQTYRVPSDYQAVDAAAGTVAGGPVTCFSVNSRSSKGPQSFVLQIMPDRKEVWTWLPVAGVYVGLAIEPARGLVYVSNSTTNEIYAVTIGDQRARPARVAVVGDAGRLGAMAIAQATRRLYVSDMGAPRVYTIELATRRVKRVNVPGVEEVRAMAWAAQSRRLFIADSGHETIWVVDPNAPQPRTERVISDKRLRDPAGIAVASDGTLWVADEASRTLFQVSAASRSITRTLAWNPR